MGFLARYALYDGELAIVFIQPLQAESISELDRRKPLPAGEVTGHLHRVVIEGRNYFETRDIFKHVLLLFSIELKFEFNT